jgi:hypothetical protein
MKIKWLDKPSKQDYSAAATYLSLTMDPEAAKAISKQLENAEMTEFEAKDVLRASGLSLPEINSSHVQKDQADIISEEKLSPILLYRDKANGKLVIADGYHRLCAIYKIDEDAVIACKIV